ncbi:hypothetical protein B484DRAFT_398859 [Ochromonadaceae sp. CCMP2298]|nr:hypothetical protein B484DRAFT_398859 [Ochromonadaceae sp. CCMP2298]
MVRVLRYVDSGELVESDDEDDTGSQDTGREQQLRNDDVQMSESDDGGAVAVIGPVVPMLQAGGAGAAAHPKPLTSAQKQHLFREMQMRYRSCYRQSVQPYGTVIMSATGVTDNFVAQLKLQLDGRQPTARAPRIDTKLSSFLYYVTEMATNNVFSAALLQAKPAADAMRLASLLAAQEELVIQQAAKDEFLGSDQADAGLGCIFQENHGEVEEAFLRVVLSRVRRALVKTASFYSASNQLAEVLLESAVAKFNPEARVRLKSSSMPFMKIPGSAQDIAAASDLLPGLQAVIQRKTDDLAKDLRRYQELSRLTEDPLYAGAAVIATLCDTTKGQAHHIFHPAAEALSFIPQQLLRINEAALCAYPDTHAQIKTTKAYRSVGRVREQSSEAVSDNEGEREDVDDEDDRVVENSVVHTRDGYDSDSERSDLEDVE